ncbi:hypothetical protein [Armatimonas sp.]|uniref:hypothetical protein n=1 Tax=Armatimonas sp. TaxID=1872638 RepID=UPI00286AC4C0|nr:hypothetical protein [Armatimonas sp.]
MNFFKREHRLTELIRTADPLEGLECLEGEGTLAIPSPLKRAMRGLALPLMALVFVGIWWVASPKTSVVREKSHIIIKKSDVSFIKSEVGQKNPDIAREKSHVAIKKSHIVRRKPSLSRRKSWVGVRKLRVARAKRHITQEKPKILPPENRDSGEMIVVAVRPITPDELRQELQTP